MKGREGVADISEGADAPAFEVAGDAEDTEEDALAAGRTDACAFAAAFLARSTAARAAGIGGGARPPPGFEALGPKESREDDRQEEEEEEEEEEVLSSAAEGAGKSPYRLICVSYTPYEHYYCGTRRSTTTPTETKHKLCSACVTLNITLQ